MKGATCRTVALSAAASEPTCQNRIRSRAALSPSSTALVQPWSSAVTAVPASASRTGVADRLPPTT